MQDAIDRLVDASRRLGPGEHRDIIETYRMFAADRGWLGRINEAVRSGLTAEAAVQKVRDETRSRMMQVTEPYLDMYAGRYDQGYAAIRAARLQKQKDLGLIPGDFQENPGDEVTMLRFGQPCVLVNQPWEDLSASDQAAFSTEVQANNIRVTAAAFAGGITLGLLTVQVLLGTEAWFSWMKRYFVASAAGEESAAQHWLRSGHYVVGAVLFATTVVFVLQAYRNPQAAEVAA